MMWWWRGAGIDMPLYIWLFPLGLFSSTMRELTSVGHDGPKWIVLDGDIDPMWIESLNTVMDDNKVRVHFGSLVLFLFHIINFHQPKRPKAQTHICSCCEQILSSVQVLTLASNERISLSSSMRLLFEISHLKAATPATVSRAGILYVNPQDLGWSS